MDDPQYKHFFNQSLQYLSKRDHTTHEMEIFLKKRNASDDQVKTIIRKLTDLKFLDDEKYARMWIEERIVLRPKSYYLIRLELIKKGVSKEILDKVFNLLNEDKNSTEREMAKSAANKIIKRTQKLPMEKAREKLIRYLSARGFSWEIIKVTIDENFQKE